MKELSQSLAAGFLFLGGCILLLAGLLTGSDLMIALTALLALFSGAVLIYLLYRFSLPSEQGTSNKEEHSNEDA